MWQFIKLNSKLVGVFIAVYIVALLFFRIVPGLLLMTAMIFIMASNLIAVKDRLLVNRNQSFFFFLLPLVLLFIGESLFYPGLWNNDTIKIYEQISSGRMRLSADTSVIFPYLGEFGYRFVDGPLYYIFFIILSFLTLQSSLYKALLDYRKSFFLWFAPIALSSPAIIILMMFPGRDALFGLIAATVFLCVVPLKKDLLSDKKRLAATAVLLIYACMLRPEGRFLAILCIPLIFHIFGNKISGLLKAVLVMWMVVLLPSVLNKSIMSVYWVTGPAAYNHSLKLHVAIHTLAEADNQKHPAKVDKLKTEFGDIFHVPFEEVERTRNFTSNGWAHFRFIGHSGRTARDLGIKLHEVRRWERAVVKSLPKEYLQIRLKMFSYYFQDLWTFRDMAREPDLNPVFEKMAIPSWPEESLVYKTLRVFQGVHGPNWLQDGITLFIWLPWWLVLQMCWQVFHPGRLQEHGFYWVWLVCSVGVVFFITPEPRFPYIFYIYLITMLMSAFLARPKDKVYQE